MLRACSSVPLLMLLAAALSLQSATESLAVVLIDDDFTAAEGYADGLLQFQSPDGGGNGTWLGQINSTVDSTGDGFVNVVTGNPPDGAAFLRNLWSLGATGTPAGGPDEPGREVGSGFALGDKIKVDVQFQFTLPNGTQNHALFLAGVSDCYVECGFNAVPRAGLNLGVSEFQAGAFKVFTHMGRTFTSGTDNPFGVLLPLADVGLNNGWNPETMAKDLPTDLESDLISLSYTAELIDESNKIWQATELVVMNVTTDTELTTASVDNPNALEQFVWDSLANAPDVNPTTPTEQGQAAHPDAPGSEMYFAIRWTGNLNAGGTSSFDKVRFEYIPNVPFVEGDYNGNGVVDVADYTVWRDSLGSVGGELAADGTGDDDLGVPDGDVDVFDYLFWRNRFGNTAPGTALQPASTPEPAAVVSILVMGILGLTRRKASLR